MSTLPENLQKVGVVGAGSFGTAIANLLSLNTNVLIYSRQEKLVQNINEGQEHMGLRFNENVKATSSFEHLAQECTLIFPIISSINFREVMQKLSPYLRPYHLLIHGTKGFDITGDVPFESDDIKLSRSNVHTMSEVIRQETSVVRVGCLSGPNLAVEILEGQPAATVIGSRFNEVIKSGRKVLDSDQFHTFGTHEMLGAELAGVLKNAIAIGSGILGGLGLGKNIQAMLITRGLMEMVYVGKAMGASSKAFIGIAGIGDLVATATSPKSRNYTFGAKIASGMTMKEVRESMPELAEGVRTIKIMRLLARSHKIHVPITDMLYSVIFEDFDIKRAINYLMNYPYAVDVDFF